jgi:ketosteroid isomerase-like protein
MKTAFKLSVMFPLFFCLIAPAMMPVLAAEKVRISEQQVQMLIKSLDEAVHKKDTKAIIDFLAEDARITFKVDLPQGKADYDLDRKEYATYLEKAMAAMTDYECERKDTKIKVAEDGMTAEATDRVVEKMTVNGKKMGGESKQKATFILKGEKLLIKTSDTVMLSIN